MYDGIRRCKTVGRQISTDKAFSRFAQSLFFSFVYVVTKHFFIGDTMMIQVVFGFFMLATAAASEVNAVYAHAEMYLADTNISIGTISFYEEEEDWGVVISGSVNRLRPTASLVC